MQTRYSFFVSPSVLAVGIAFACVASPGYAASWTKIASSTVQTVPIGVNNLGEVVSNGRSTNPTHPFASTVIATNALGQSTELQPLTPVGQGGFGCKAFLESESNLAAGVCLDNNNVKQGVIWNLNNPSGAPAEIKPIQRVLVPSDVSVIPTAMNDAGVVAAESISGNGVATPGVVTGGTVAPFPTPLLGSNDNCMVADINQGGEDGIIANCPAGPGGGGTNVARYWFSPTSMPVDLPLPPNAIYCLVKEMNNNSQILGVCRFSGANGGTPDTFRAALWQAGANFNPNAAPIVLETLDGKSPLRTEGVDINSAGEVIGTALRDPTGATLVFKWAPLVDGGNGHLVSLPAGAVRALPVRIGDNGVALINLELNGLSTAAVVPAGSTTANPIAPLLSGGNSVGTDMSKNGQIIAGASESDTNGSVSAAVGTTP